MSAFPNFSNILPYVQTTMNSRKNNMFISELDCWVRVVSAVGNGAVLLSNPKASLFGAKGIYGIRAGGMLGYNWQGGILQYTNTNNDDLAGRPLPVVTSFEVDEGTASTNSITRKAKFTIKCFTPAQLHDICEYYLEPGFSVFLEWGWNTAASVGSVTKLDVETIAAYQNFEKVHDKRKMSNAESDVFLGFITGGTIQSSGTTWEVNVDCHGFPELPAYFMNADSHRQLDIHGNLVKEDGSAKTGMRYEPKDIDNAADLDAKRFMMAFNALPSNMQTYEVSRLLGDVDVANIMNFINYDESVAAAANAKAPGYINDYANNQEIIKSTRGLSANIPSKSNDANKPIGDEKFIRFGALVKMMNAKAAKGYAIGNDQCVLFEIDTTTSVISAFPKIFSTDKSKLFIPNPQTPHPTFVSATGTTDQVKFGDPIDNTVKGTKAFTNKLDKVTFPMNAPIKDGMWNGIALTYTDESKGIPGIDKEENQWGFLNDLYVNADFAKGILDTKNFVIKDALYQILNGLSSAAGGMWDFQIESVPIAADTDVKSAGIVVAKMKKGDTILKVVDLNFIPIHKDDPIYTFELQGIHSIFMQASFDMNISGARMNQIIAQRNNVAQNSSMSAASYGKLFSGKQDMILQKIYGMQDNAQAAAGTPPPAAKTKPSPEDEAKKKKIFNDKLAMYPHVKDDKTAPDFGDDPFINYYLGAYSDSNFFESFKLENQGDQKAQKLVTPPMGIKFNFTIHGVSGLNRGDKFKVHGIPKDYYDSGFFQIRGIKHTLEGMLWKTEVTGEYRRIYDSISTFDATEVHVPDSISASTKPSQTFNAEAVVNNTFNVKSE